MNLFRMERKDGLLQGVDHPDAVLPFPSGADVEPGAIVLAGVRPHDMRVTTEGTNGIPVIVDFTEHLGRNNHVICEFRGTDAFLHEQETIQVETPAGTAYEPRTELLLTADPSAIRLFDVDGWALDSRESLRSSRATATASAAAGA